MSIQIPEATAASEHAAGTTSTVSMLNVSDNCDRCGARAYVLVVFDGGLQLTFCGHHARAHHDALAAAALIVHDESARLARAPA